MAKERDNPYVTKTDGTVEITDKGREYLETKVTNTESNVYAFTSELGSATIGAAFARLSRNSNDTRAIILDEFTELPGRLEPVRKLLRRFVEAFRDNKNATHSGKEEALLGRVITAFGDDSVQQLAAIHIVVEDASNLLTKELEWGRLASYLEQSTRYIYFDKKDKDGKYRYFTPEHLSDEATEEYESKMDGIFENYSETVHDLTEYIASKDSTPEDERDGAWRAAVRAQACDAARPMLPASTKSTVGIFGSAQALENMIMRLRASDSIEARETGDKILQEVRKVSPTFFERADKPERGGATTAYIANTRNDMRDLASEILPEQETAATEAVRLLEFAPPQELDLLRSMLYEHSDQSLQEIEQSLADLPEEERKEAFQVYFGERLNRRHRPGRALENAHYAFDLVCDYGIFRDLQRHRMVDDLRWQKLSPKLGYEVPDLVEEAGLTDRFEKNFKDSSDLYNYLKDQGLDHEAQYATLLGHKMRWKVTMNAREAFHFFELRTGPAGHPGYRKLAKQMYDEVKKVHPLIAGNMRFINEDEDPELTRLAAERAAQYKLEKIDKNM